MGIISKQTVKKMRMINMRISFCCISIFRLQKAFVSRSTRLFGLSRFFCGIAVAPFVVILFLFRQTLPGVGNGASMLPLASAGKCEPACST